MIRKLAFALSLLGVMIAESVFALGIGEATVKSALNQPLKAEIELVNSGELTAKEVLPGLATREEFLKANVDRVYFLSDLRFKVETNENGKLVVVLTTNKPVREPFLNFLVEVIWPSGRLLREYALLIDPPVFSEEPVAPVRAASVASASVQSGDVCKIPDAAPVSRRSVANPSAGIAAGEYGPTGSSDTLWDIAMKARPNRSVSPQQVMLAIQDLNPGAFIQGNINKLKAGQILRLPSLAQIKQRSSHQAIEQVITQNEAARGKRTKSVASSQAPAAPVTQAAPANSASDELKLVVAERTNETASSANSGTAADGTGGKESDPKLALTLEKLDKANIENQDLNGRVTDLEEQLKTLQRLLTLKNDQLATIQSQMRANDLAEAEALQDQEQLQADADRLMSMPGDTGVEADAVAANDQASSDAVSNKESAKASESNIDSQAKATAMTDVTDGAKALSVAPKALDSTASSPEKTAKTEQNIIEVIVGNTLYLSITILAVIVLVFALWLISRNNAKREEEYQALRTSQADQDSAEATEPAEDVYYVEASDEGLQGESLAPELEEEESIDEDLYAEEDQEPVSNEVVDIIAEADVYIAYGRLDQAVAVLEGAISESPVRTDLRLKLLEVYKQSGDTEAFNRQFSELEAIQDADALEHASTLRADMLDEQLVSIEDKEHELEQDRELEAAQAAQREAESSIVTEAEALDDEPQSFNFDSVELEDGSPDELSLGDDLGAELDQDLDLGEELASELTDSEDFDDAILDVDLDDIDLSEELDQETEIQLPSNLSDSALVDSLSQGASIADAEKPVISDDILEQAAEKLNSEQPLDEELVDTGEFDFLEGTDEASTKLDLARAYIDMGDVEGAKDILEEVTKEGNPEQQAEASNLLDSIAS